jgi:NAD(P)H-flavin reductase
MATPALHDAATATPALFRVRRTKRELREVLTVELDPAERLPLLFSAGQFNMLYVFGVGEAAISICGSPLEPGPLVHTIRAAGATTRAICGLKRGQTVGVRGPFGVGWPMEAAIGQDVVLIAGGIGLAPLRPVVYQIIAQRERFGRVALLVGARRPADLLSAEQLMLWRSRFDLDVHVTVDSDGGNWRGDVGVVTTLIARAKFEAAETIGMVCGPEVMMRFCASGLRERGVPADQIFLSLERNMKCAVGVCGHCQYGPTFVCRDGPVFALSRIERLLRIREV